MTIGLGTSLRVQQNIIRNRILSKVWAYQAQPFKQSEGMVHTWGMGVKLDQLLVDHLQFLVHLYPSTSCTQEQLDIKTFLFVYLFVWFCLGWSQCPSLSTGVLVGYRTWLAETLDPPVLGVLDRVTLIDSWNFSLHQVSSSDQICPLQIQLSESVIA